MGWYNILKQSGSVFKIPPEIDQQMSAMIPQIMSKTLKMEKQRDILFDTRSTAPPDDISIGFINVKSRGNLPDYKIEVILTFKGPQSVYLNGRKEYKQPDQGWYISKEAGYEIEPSETPGRLMTFTVEDGDMDAHDIQPTIYLNSYYFSSNNPRDILNTFRHEIIHALDPKNLKNLSPNRDTSGAGAIYYNDPVEFEAHTSADLDSFSKVVARQNPDSSILNQKVSLMLQYLSQGRIRDIFKDYYPGLLAKYQYWSKNPRLDRMFKQRTYAILMQLQQKAQQGVKTPKPSIARPVSSPPVSPVVLNQ